MINSISFIKGKPDVAILTKDIDVQESKRTTLATSYLTKLLKLGLENPGEKVEFIGLPYPKSGNIKKDFILENLEEILEYCDTKGISTILVSDSKYFPVIAGQKKTEEVIGKTFKCSIKGYEHLNILPCINPIAIAMNPSKAKVFDNALSVLKDVVNGTYIEDTYAEIDAKFPVTYPEIDKELSRLEKLDLLTVDIESRAQDNDQGDALRYERGMLSTIAISDSETSGVGFITDEHFSGDDLLEIQVRQRLKLFFERTLSDPDKKIVLHNGLFDAKYLIRTLFMKSNDDYDGMYHGIRLFSNMYDTMIMAYLCLNSSTKPEKGLKVLSKDHLGDYGEDVKDITKLPIEKLLLYNVKDTCGTMYVFNKYYSMLKSEDQLDVFNEIFRPSQAFLLEMMMTGLPLDLNKVTEVKNEFEELKTKSLEIINSSEYVKRTVSVIRYNEKVKYNSTHKKQKTDDDFLDVEFNPSSLNQKKILLFDILGLQVKDTTDTGAPAIGAKVIREYIAEASYNEDDDVATLLNALLDYDKAGKMTGTFLSAFEELSTTYSNGECYLKGNLKLGATVSGRLASSEP